MLQVLNHLNNEMYIVKNESTPNKYSNILKIKYVSSQFVI